MCCASIKICGTVVRPLRLIISRFTASPSIVLPSKLTPCCLTAPCTMAKRTGCFGVDFNIYHDFAPVYPLMDFPMSTQVGKSFPCVMKTTGNHSLTAHQRQRLRRSSSLAFPFFFQHKDFSKPAFVSALSGFPHCIPEPSTTIQSACLCAFPVRQHCWLDFARQQIGRASDMAFTEIVTLT